MSTPLPTASALGASADEREPGGASAPRGQAGPAIPRFPVRRSLGMILVIAGPALVVAAGVAWALGGAGEAGIGAACWAVCVIAAIAGLYPLRLASRYGLDKVAMATLVSVVARLVVAGVGAAGLVAVAGAPLRDTMLWTGGWYLVMLVAEVVAVQRYFAACPAPGSVPGSAPAAAPSVSHSPSAISHCPPRSPQS